MQHCATIAFTSDHPTGPGHFPSNPMIPGAVLLDEAVAAMLGGAACAGVTIKATKFLSAVRPGESVELRWQILDGAEIQFECRHAAGAALVMTGRLERGSAAP